MLALTFLSRCNGFIEGQVFAKSLGASVDADLRGPLLIGAVPIDARMTRRIVVAEANTITAVLGLCAEAKVGASVIEPVAIDVIHQHLLGSRKDHPVHREVVILPVLPFGTYGVPTHMDGVPRSRRRSLPLKRHHRFSILLVD